jgi:hypothetical protein
MESSDLNRSSAGDAELEAWLRRGTPALADDGFSARVVAALPPPRRSLLRPLLCTAAGMLGIAIAFYCGAFASPAWSTEAWRVEWQQIVAPLRDRNVLFGIVVAIACIGYALRCPTSAHTAEQ